MATDCGDAPTQTLACPALSGSTIWRALSPNESSLESSVANSGQYVKKACSNNAEFSTRYSFNKTECSRRITWK